MLLSTRVDVKTTCGSLKMMQRLRMITLIILHVVDHMQGTMHERSMHASHSQQASRGLSVGLGAVLSCLDFKLVELMA